MSSEQGSQGAPQPSCPHATSSGNSKGNQSDMDMDLTAEREQPVVSDDKNSEKKQTERGSKVLEEEEPGKGRRFSTRQRRNGM